MMIPLKTLSARPHRGQHRKASAQDSA